MGATESNENDEENKKNISKEKNADISKNISKGEEETGKCLKNIFKYADFKKVRPDLLKNPDTGYNLEIDFYSKKFNLAVEYNGKQHYEYVSVFHKNGEKDLHDQIKKDEYKQNILKENNICYIIVKYDIKNKDIETFILEEICSKYPELIEKMKKKYSDNVDEILANSLNNLTIR